ncbi:MAG: 50S ribosomal protein L25 [Patescibacteria group bacterium]|jgi:large subunit ribosomal protein L25
MENIKLTSSARQLIGKKVKQLRRDKKIPAVLYGKGYKNKNLVLDFYGFTKVVKQAGSSTLVSLSIDEEKPIKILIGKTQHNPVTREIIHADLIKVNMKEKIHTDIRLELIGESPAVADLEGNLITSKDSIEVECLPDDLIPHIDVDISVLKTFDDNIKVTDLNIPSGIEVLEDPEEILIQVTAPRSEEELEAELAPASEEEAIAELEAQVGGEETAEEGESKEKTEEKTQE